MQKVFAVAVGEPKIGEGRVFRSIHSPDELVAQPLPEIKTLYDVIQYAAKTYGARNAIGYRTLTQMVEEEKEVTKIINGVEKKEKKMWKYFQLSGYTWLSCAEVAETVKSIGGGLRRLGLEKGSHIAIYASTSANWTLMAHGCFTQSCTIVTAYDTLGEDGLLHSMNESEVAAIFTNADLLPVIQKVAGKCPTLKHVIYDGEPKTEVVDKLRNTHTALRFSSFDDLINLGREFRVEPVPPASTDLCCIMYTSGSTGNPKGVMLTHANIIATVAGVTKALKHHIQDEDVMLAYLPLAHVLEFFVEQTCIFNGVPLGYGSVRTLTDASVRNCLGDIRELRPTIMAGVPAVWESIRKGILSKVHAASPTSQKVFNAAFKAKSWLIQKHMPTTLLDTVVFDKIKQQTGGRLRFMISGGAPISRETQEFLTVTLCPVLQGYGMTESCGMCALLTPEQFALGTVGSPVASTEIKLVDVPEAGYASTNTPRPQGEILIRGPGIATGYYKNEQLTKETFTEDGWLQTGDIGEWHSDGTLYVIDRKKNLVKLSHGEYIALERLESVYKSCLYVSNIMVYADSFQTRPVALIYPVEQQLVRLAKEKGITNLDLKHLCENEEINAVVLESLLAQAKKASLKPAELLAAVDLVPDEWTAQNGLLTAAQKLKRRDLVNKYKSNLDKLYGAK